MRSNYLPYSFNYNPFAVSYIATDAKSLCSNCQTRTHARTAVSKRRTPTDYCAPRVTLFLAFPLASKWLIVSPPPIALPRRRILVGMSDMSMSAAAAFLLERGGKLMPQDLFQLSLLREWHALCPDGYAYKVSTYTSRSFCRCHHQGGPEAPGAGQAQSGSGGSRYDTGTSL